MTVSAHHYAFDAVPLLDDCIDKLQKTIDQDLRGRHDALYDMKEALVSTEQLLHRYLAHVLETERQSLVSSRNSSSSSNNNNNMDSDISCIMGTMAGLKAVLEEQRKQEEVQHRKVKFWNPQEDSSERRHSYYTARSATDTLLFRLIVALQLCLVRIDDAHFVITGSRIGVTVDEQRTRKRFRLAIAAGCCVAGAGVATVSLSRQREIDRPVWLRKDGQHSLLGVVAKAGAALIVGKWLNTKWRTLWMTDKVVRSTNEISEWMQQWQMVQSTATPKGQMLEHQKERSNDATTSPTIGSSSSELLDDKSRRLIEYAMQHSSKSYVWQSQGEIRFMMLKRFMDVYYASVGTAIDTNQTSTWQLPLMTGAAASFYSLTGASQKASQAVNTGSRDLIQHAWGMVSLPAIKSLMLQASRLIKGASVADRIDICGVPCFVLSRDPAPELAAALKRKRKTTSLLSSLSTIAESEEEHTLHENNETSSSYPKKFAGSCGRYRQRDVLFHLTGGGFFAHTIASDLPYLLDWSASTGAVVICPEYALLPEHTFPVALEQITEVYSALVDGDAVIDLGFEVNRIVVTGESAGGNLAAALCVKLGLQKLAVDQVMNELVEESGDASDAMSTDTVGGEPTQLPDAIMLCCAALNLSLEVSHSRVVGTKDPVLPSGLISAISDAYLPPGSGSSKQDPLASPFFAPDAVLRLFPPTLLFAGSNDPLLDDSVAFNERLRCVGVESELRAAHNMPHAYWGLGTAGFPEARQVQQECQEWLARQLR